MAKWVGETAVLIRFLDLKEKLKNNVYPCLCLYGNDEWVKRRAVANVCEALGIDDDGFAVDRLESPSLSDITLACMTQGLFADKKLVLCEGFAFSEGAKLKSEQKQLAELLRQYDGGFCLVFVADSDKNFDVEGVEKVNCNRLDKDSVAKWIMSYCKRSQVSVDRLCAEKLAVYCLNDMSRVSVETQKLLDYGEFSVQSVEQLVHKDAEYVVYDLSQVIADKNAGRAVEIYRGLVSRGEDARSLFALLYNFYRRVYYVKTSAFSSEETAAYLNVKAGAVGFAKDTAKRYKPMQLSKALEYFEQADLKLKAFLDENEVMNALIMQLVSL